MVAIDQPDHTTIKICEAPSHIDDVLENTKPYGRYQIFLTFIYVYAMCPLSVNNGFMAFNDTPKFICNDNNQFKNVSPTSDCDTYYNCAPSNVTLVVQFYSIADQWLLICDRSYTVNLITSIQMIGDLIGVLVIGYISDSLGRKWTLICVLSVQFLLGGLSALSTSWQMFTVFRFFIGFCAGAEMVAGWVLIAECTTNRYRYLIRAIASCTVAQFDQTLVAYLTKNWKGYSIYGNVQALPLIPLLIFGVYESPRWLAQKGRTDESLEVLRKIARFNGVQHELPSKLEIEKSPTKKYYPWHLFQSRKLAVYSIACILIWFIIGTINYGMYFDVSSLPENIYMSMTILSLFSMLELPLAIYDAYNPKVNRKWTSLAAFATLVLSNVAVVLMLAVVSTDSAGYNACVSVMSVVGQVAANVAFDQAYLYAIELFPTLLRSTAGSFCSFGARIGAIIAPQLLYFQTDWTPLPYVCFAVMAAIGVLIVASVLPNTKNMHLPDVFEALNDPIIEPQRNYQ